MSSQPTDDDGEPDLVVPASVQEVIAGFEARAEPFGCMDVQSALSTARQALTDPSPAEHKGAWAEILAFGLTGTEHDEKPWGTYFGPMGSGANAAGDTIYFPDATQADSSILDQWRNRAASCTAPVLVARYSDLVWDLSKLIANEKRDVIDAHRAMDAYMTAAEQASRDPYDAFPDVERALLLAIQLSDANRRDKARGILLRLHTAAVTNGGMWWRAPAFFESQPKAALTDAERQAIIADLETVLGRTSDRSSPAIFDPHDAERAAAFLVPLYRESGDEGRIADLHRAVAGAFEHFGSMSDPMLAGLVFQTSSDAYRRAGDLGEAERVQKLVEASNAASIQQMTPHEFSMEVSKEEIDEFLGRLVTGTLEQTFWNLALNFLLRQESLQEFLAQSAKDFPLSTIIPHTMIQGERVVAQIGSLQDDPFGHLISQASQHLMLNGPWLAWALERTRSQYPLTADAVVQWTNRTSLFGNGALLTEGVEAWLADDHIKAMHILVPQVETAFRKMVGLLGRPTTKPHPQMRQARMVITLGEMLGAPETTGVLGTLGADFVLHMRALYADPRGHNLRNDIAHGLMPVERFGPLFSQWVIHTLLMLGAWLQPPAPALREAAGDDDHE